jgi:hypothetical protein
MRTWQKRLDYRALNDGSNEEALPEDRIKQSSGPLSSLAPTLPVSQEDVETTTNVVSRTNSSSVMSLPDGTQRSA